MYKVFASSWKDSKGNYKTGTIRKTTIIHTITEQEARDFCLSFNDGKRTAKQIRESYKYEYTKV